MNETMNGDGNVFRIERATRRGVPALISLWGPSGSGKTYSALLLARGLVGPAGKIGLIDTENQRAKFYAALAGGWDHLDLQPPFTPERYRAAFEAFERAGGYGAVIVDSMSHVWEGEGGVLDMADAQRTRDGKEMYGLAKWRSPKMAYKRMLNALLRAPYHVVFCLRAKEKMRQEGAGPTAQIVSAGLVPTVEKNFVYEMTIDARLEKATHVPEDIKCPADLLDAFPRGKPISVETGAAIAAWVNGGAPVDHAAEAARRVARDVATLGTEAIAQHWKGLKPAEQRVLKPIAEELKAIAAEADRGRAAEAEGEADQTGDPLADPFTPKGGELLAAG